MQDVGCTNLSGDVKGEHGVGAAALVVHAGTSDAAGAQPALDDTNGGVCVLYGLLHQAGNKDARL